MVGSPDAPVPLDTLMPVPAVIVRAVRVLAEVRAAIPLDAVSDTVPRLALAFAAVDAPVPPSATAKSVMPVIVPPVIAALAVEIVVAEIVAADTVLLS